ncbi:MAG: tRNA-dihydrouridine synthase family protein, partial [Clostridia bacterium]|nr:tRNA-dihydrouridine synthase family protein [Clostridia bacterium]
MVQIGDLTLPEGAALAPMAGVSDAAMRLLCGEQGAAWCVSEMLSAKGWIYSQGKNRAAQELLTRFEGEKIAALQLFGSDSGIMADAVQSLESAGFEFFDVNFGCPAPKITGNGEGSAMMNDPDGIGRIVRAMADATKKPVTVKIRAGWDADHINAVQVAQICEQAGAAAIAVHGRTRSQQ